MDSSKVPKCGECLANMKEYVKLRDMPEYLTLNVVPMEMVQTPRFKGKLYKKFVVILRGRCTLYPNCVLNFIAFVVDELAPFNIVLGNAYIITGTYDGIKRAFFAWNIVEVEDV